MRWEGWERWGLGGVESEIGGGLADIPQHPRTWKFIRNKWTIRKLAFCGILPSKNVSLPIHRVKKLNPPARFGRWSVMLWGRECVDRQIPFNFPISVTFF